MGPAQNLLVTNLGFFGSSAVESLSERGEAEDGERKSFGFGFSQVVCARV